MAAHRHPRSFSRISRTTLCGLLPLFCGLVAAQDQAPESLIGGKPPKPSGEELLNGLGDAVNTTANILCALNSSLCAASPPGARGPSRPTNYDDRLYYELPITKYTSPGVQTRPTIDPLFPDQFFDENSQLDITEYTSRRDVSILTPAQILRIREGPGATLAGWRPHVRRLASAPPVATGSNGGWTMLSVDSGVVAIHAIPLANGQVLFMERPGNRESPPLIAALYNLNNNTYRRFPMPDSPFCSGHLQLTTGQVLIVGGDNVDLVTGFSDGRYNIRVFQGGANPVYNVVAQMVPNRPASVDPDSGARWYPSVATMTDGNILIVGGQTTEGGGYDTLDTFVNPSYQFFLTSNSTITNSVNLPLLTQTQPITLYPFIALLPITGRVMILSGNVTRFYSYSPGLLTQNGAGYPAVPNLPIPILYPQTSCITLLPLELPSYTPRILVAGGSSAPFADPNTPATSNTYLLDLSQATAKWQIETMSAARVMPDVVILPDGTLFICNGGNVGIAGGAPGGGTAANTNGLALAGEIYNPTMPFGSRMSGLLATSGRSRLYHSQAWLTRNAEVLVTGSEVTEDYTMQIYTPPYLVGTFARPVITNPSSTSPAYGASITLSLSYARQGNTAIQAISRVVLVSDNGITHSTHFDQRSVACSFTTINVNAAGTGTLRVTMPPNATIAPPSNYMLFSVTSGGRPSQAVYIGLGGATPAASLYFEPRIQPILPNGTYTITAAGRSGCSSFLSYPFCNVSNNVAMGTQGVWQINYIPTAYASNTYTIRSQQRIGSCNTYMGSQSCDVSDGLFLYPADLLSGNQEWTISAANGGGYYIQDLIGRGGCSTVNTYLSASACGSSAVSLGNLTAATVWRLTAVAAPPISPQAPFVPVLPNGQYYIQADGMSDCQNALSYDPACGNSDAYLYTGNLFNLVIIPGSVQVNNYNIIATNRSDDCQNYLSAIDCSGNFIDLFGNDDGSGRQEYEIIPSSYGGYNLRVDSGRNGCPMWVTAQGCGNDNGLIFAASNASILSSFRITTTLNQTGSPYFTDGVYYIQNTERSACANFLNATTCANGNGVSMGTSGYFMLTLLTTASQPNTYQVTAPQRSQCNSYLSSNPCPQNLVNMYSVDDGSGRQEWIFNRTTSGGYNIQVAGTGRSGCASFLASSACSSTGQNVLLAASGAAGNYAVWNVTAGSGIPPAPPVLTPGTFQISNVGRTNCSNNYLGSVLCSQGNTVSMETGGTWTLSYVQNAAQGNTFEVISTSRAAAQCAYTFMSATDCYADEVDIYNQDDGSGRQQWVFTRVAGGYTITMPMGRSGCNQTLTSTTCNSSTNPNLVTFGAPSSSALQLWSIDSVATPAPVAQLIPNGNYYIQSIGRQACTNFTSATNPCSSNINSVDLEAFTSTGLQTWTFTAIGTNLYNIQNTLRSQCYNYLSAIDCSGNFVDQYYQDDGSGRQQWQVAAVTGGYTISMPNGRNGCQTYLTASTCSGSTGLTFVNSPTSTAQTFAITPINSAAG